MPSQKVGESRIGYGRVRSSRTLFGHAIAYEIVVGTEVQCL